MRLPRWMHHAYAYVAGYFWLPCPLCGEPFGGHEWLPPGPQKSSIHAASGGGGTGICPNCTRRGLGTWPS